MIYREPGFFAVKWFGLPTTNLLLSRQQVASLSQSSCVAVENTGRRGGAGGATKSYDGKKAWSLKNHSILSAVDNTACSVFFSSINHKYLSLVMSICYFPTITYGYLHFSSLDYSIRLQRLSTSLISSLMITLSSPPKNHGRLSTAPSHPYAVVISPFQNNLFCSFQIDWMPLKPRLPDPPNHQPWFSAPLRMNHGIFIILIPIFFFSLSIVHGPSSPPPPPLIMVFTVGS